MRIYKVLEAMDIVMQPQRVADLNEIAAAVSPGKVAPTHDAKAWIRIASAAELSLVACIEDDRIIGIGSVIVVDIPSRTKAYVEDVAVSAQHRKRGIATGIAKELERIARQKGAPYVYLTSSRPDAQRLWTKLGYERGQTNAYAKKL